MKNHFLIFVFVMFCVVCVSPAMATDNPYKNAGMVTAVDVPVTIISDTVTMADTSVVILDGANYQHTIGRVSIFMKPLMKGLNEKISTEGNTRVIGDSNVVKYEFYKDLIKEHVLLTSPETVRYSYDIELSDWVTTEPDLSKPRITRNANNSEIVSYPYTREVINYAQDSTTDITLDPWGNIVFVVNGADVAVIPKPYAIDTTGKRFELDFELDKANKIITVTGDMIGAQYPVMIDPTERVTNGGFETGDLSGWTGYGDIQSYRVVSGDAYEGTYYLDVIGAESQYTGITQTIDYTGVTSISSAAAIPVINIYDIPLSNEPISIGNWLIDNQGQNVEGWTVRSATPTLTGLSTLSVWTYSSTHGHIDSIKATGTTYGPARTPDDDHYVSFDLRVNDLAPNYAYDLVCRGEPGNNPWVYNIYMFGWDSSGMDGRIAVYGYSSGGWILASPTSPPLTPGQNYNIVWRYNITRGGELFINGISQGSPTGGGSLDTTLSSSFHIGENMLPSPPYPARAHSELNGQITNVYHWDRDLDGVVTPPPQTGSISISSDPSGATIYLDDVNQGVTPQSLENIPFGVHVVKLTLDNYQDWSGNVELTSASQSARVNPTLNPVPIPPSQLIAKNVVVHPGYQGWATFGREYSIIMDIENPAGTQTTRSIAAYETTIPPALKDDTQWIPELPYPLFINDQQKEAQANFYYLHTGDPLYYLKTEEEQSGSLQVLKYALSAEKIKFEYAVDKAVESLEKMGGRLKLLEYLQVGFTIWDYQEIRDESIDLLTHLKCTPTITYIYHFTGENIYAKLPLYADPTTAGGEIFEGPLNEYPGFVVTVQVQAGKFYAFWNAIIDETLSLIYDMIGFGAGQLGHPELSAGCGYASLFTSMLADQSIKQALDPVPDYTAPVEIQTLHLTEIDSLPDGAGKEYLLQLETTYSDTTGLTDAMIKYNGAVAANDPVWADKLLKEQYKYQSLVSNDYYALKIKAVPFIEELQQEGINPTANDIQSAKDDISQNGLPEWQVTLYKKYGYNDNDLDIIKDLILTVPDRFYVNYSSMILIGHQMSENLNTESLKSIAYELGDQAPPYADFSASTTSGKAPLSVQFTDASLRSPNQWAWEFGDGETATTQNAAHTYTTAGTYTVELTATNSGTGSDTRTKYDYITVTADPVALIDQLIQYINSQNINNAAKKIYISQLNRVKTSLVTDKPGDAIIQLKVFQLTVQVAQGKVLTPEQASKIQDSVTAIIAAINVPVNQQAIDMTKALKVYVKDLGLPKLTQGVLVLELEGAQLNLEAGKDKEALNHFTIFIKTVQSQDGKAIPHNKALQLIAKAQDVVNVIQQ